MSPRLMRLARQLRDGAVALALAALLGVALGLLAPSNDPRHRRSASDRLFKRMIAPQEPAIVIDAGCIGLIQGYAGGFHYPKRGPVVRLTPAKNRFSHVVEADEYAHLSVEGLDPAEERFIRRDGQGAQDWPRSILPE